MNASFLRILIVIQVLSLAGTSLDATPVNAGAAGNPYSGWSMGPSRDPNFFPIGVWLQSPRRAALYKKAGINLYVGLWDGPTEAQLKELKAAGMPVICAQNEVGLAHKDDPIIIGWMHGDEPDNAQTFQGFWKSDVEKIKEAWPEIAAFRDLGPDKPYKGYGPAIPPSWVVRDYQAWKSRDPSRPIFLNLGQGVAWNSYIGRGERRGKTEDYPDYIKGCDIVSFDIYPACHDHPEVKGQLDYVPRGVSRLREHSKDQKVVWNCIECTRISNLNARATPKEVRSEVWMSLIHGSMGLIYFVHQFEPVECEYQLLQDPEMLAEVTRLNLQIQELSPALNSPSLNDHATVSGSNPGVPVASMVKQVANTTYLFTASTKSGETEATFTLANRASGTIKVIGENRTLEVSKGIFRDTFKDWDVHLYQVQP